MKDDPLQQLADSAKKIAAGMKEVKKEGLLEHSPEVKRLHMIAQALGGKEFWDDAVRMEAEIRKALCLPLFLAVCQDRHCDDWHAVFRDPEKGKEWIKAQLQQGLDHYLEEDEEGGIREGVRGEDFFCSEDEILCAFYTFEEGPSGLLKPIPSPNVQEGGEW